MCRCALMFETRKENKDLNRLLRYDKQFQRVFRRDDVVLVRRFVADVYEKHIYENVDLTQRLDPHYLYFSYRRVLDAYVGCDENTLSRRLWLEVKRVFASELVFNSYGRARWNVESMSHRELFLALFAIENPAYDFDDDHIINVFRAYLLSKMLGVLGEHTAFHLLQEQFGACVSYGSVKDDKRDVDVWVGNVPVSVKSLRAFSRKNIERLRANGKTKPALYVNEKGSFYVPLGGFIVDEGDVDDLFALVEELQDSI